MKTEKFGAGAAQNPIFRYFLCPCSMTQCTRSLIQRLNSIPRRVILSAESQVLSE